jgi:hypothetical protein
MIYPLSEIKPIAEKAFLCFSVVPQRNKIPGAYPGKRGDRTIIVDFRQRFAGAR